MFIPHQMALGEKRIYSLPYAVRDGIVSRVERKRSGNDLLVHVLMATYNRRWKPHAWYGAGLMVPWREVVAKTSVGGI